MIVQSASVSLFSGPVRVKSRALELTYQSKAKVNKVPEHSKRAQQNNCRIAPYKSDLHAPQDRAKLNDEIASSVNDGIYETEIDSFPKAFTGQVGQRVHNVAIVKLVDSPFF